MARLIDAVGECTHQPDSSDPFRSLARAIIFQQLSGRAAGTIYARMLELFAVDPGTSHLRRTDPDWRQPAEPFPAPVALLMVEDERLRSAGLSGSKVAALRDLANYFARGDLSASLFDMWSDDEIVAHLTRVRGIGRWTAEMYLIFHLGRPDILPVGDLGLNRAIKNLYGLDALPKPPDVVRIGQPWRPWASVACWYLWRSFDITPPE